jgi:hypothetical protein
VFAHSLGAKADGAFARTGLFFVSVRTAAPHRAGVLRVTCTRHGLRDLRFRDRGKRVGGAVLERGGGWCRTATLCSSAAWRAQTAWTASIARTPCRQGYGLRASAACCCKPARWAAMGRLSRAWGGVVQTIPHGRLRFGHGSYGAARHSTVLGAGCSFSSARRRSSSSCASFRC